MPAEAAIEFQSYLFFLRHFCHLVRLARPNDAQALSIRLVEEQAPLIGHLQQRPIQPAELPEIRKYLFTAWNSEAVARLSTLQAPEIRQFTNQWKPVQSYYAIYFHLVTLHFVLNGQPLKRHEPTLHWATQSILHWFPVPWSLRLNYDTGELLRFPPGTAMWAGSGWNLANNEPHSHVANFFRRTAQRNQREDWREHYRRKKKRRIPAGPRKGRTYRIADVPVDPVSIFEVLWRFRRWANYLEADTIIQGGDFLPHAVEFDEAFTEIIDTSALLLEAALCRCMGSLALDGLYQEFVALTDGKVDTAALARRRAVVCPLAPAPP